MNRYRYANVPASKNYDGLCSHFKYVGNYNLDEEHIYVTNTGGLYMFISKNKISTVEQLKAYLSEQKINGTPVTFEYEPLEEEIEPYTEEQQAVYDEIKKTVHSYKDVTNIFSTDETSAIFNVEAKRDIQTQNDNLQSQINEIKELLSTTATSALLLNNMQSDLESEVE